MHNYMCHVSFVYFKSYIETCTHISDDLEAAVEVFTDAMWKIPNQFPGVSQVSTIPAYHHDNGEIAFDEPEMTELRLGVALRRKLTAMPTVEIDMDMVHPHPRQMPMVLPASVDLSDYGRDYRHSADLLTFDDFEMRVSALQQQQSELTQQALLWVWLVGVLVWFSVMIFTFLK
jgi:hypothetical protein